MSCVSYPERKLDPLGQLAKRQSENKSNRETLEQRQLNTAPDEELERLLEVQTKRMEDMESLIQEMRSNTNEHATLLLAKLRAGASICELLGHNVKAV